MGQEVPRMSKEELRERSRQIEVLDVRSEKDWSKSGGKIPGARREDPHEVDRWMERYPREKTYALYCA